MANYIVMVRNGGQSVEFPVSGTEAAWEAYRKAYDLCELVNGACDLIDADTGEVIECYGYECDEDFWIESTESTNDDYYDDHYYEEDWGQEIGFNPYMGAYDFDC